MKPILLSLFLGLSVSLLHAADRPNIVLIMADDLGYGDLGCYGQKLIRTPNIDRLAAEGIRFTQAYAGSTVCAPSRCSLMTGLHNGHTRVRDNLPHGVFLKDDDVTVAEVLKQAGYRTGGIGKWSLGDAGTAGRATNQGFDMWFGYLNQDDAHFYYPAALDDNEGKLELPGNPTTKSRYSHDLMTERALQFIRDSQKQNQKQKDQPGGSAPFFFYGAYTIPHFASPKEDKSDYSVPSEDPYGDRDWDQRSKKYAAMMARLDRDVGRIVDLIDALGLKERTLIIFTSDNGAYGPGPRMFQSTGLLRGVKRDMYEGGIRVPFIARWPGRVPAGKVSDEILAFWDILPTFAELAGAKTPPGLDGRSALDALLGGQRSRPHEFLYWDYGHTRGQFLQAARMGNWKGVRNGLGKSIELYDLATDVGEQHDVARSHPQVVAQLERILQSAMTPSPDYPIAPPAKSKND